MKRHNDPTAASRETLVAEFDPTEYVSLIVPGQGKLEGMTFTSNDEIEEGVRLHLFLAAAQSKAWQVYRAASLPELEQILASFPLHQYLTTTITPLADGTNEY